MAELSRYGSNAARYGVGIGAAPPAPVAPIGFNPETPGPAVQPRYTGPVANPESFADPAPGPKAKPIFDESADIRKRIGRMKDAAKARSVAGIPNVTETVAPAVRGLGSKVAGAAAKIAKIGGAPLAVATELALPAIAGAFDDEAAIKNYKAPGQAVAPIGSPAPGTPEYATWQNNRNNFFTKEQAFDQPIGDDPAYYNQGRGGSAADATARDAVVPTIGTMSIAGVPGAESTLGADGQIQRSAAWEKGTQPVRLASASVNPSKAAVPAIGGAVNYGGAANIDERAASPFNEDGSRRYERLPEMVSIGSQIKSTMPLAEARAKGLLTAEQQEYYDKRDLANKQINSGREVAAIGAESDRYQADKGLEAVKFGATEAANARKYAADQKAIYEPNKTEKAKIDASAKREERIIAGRALLMSKPEFLALDETQQNSMLERLAVDPDTDTWVPGSPDVPESGMLWWKKPEVPAVAGRRVPKESIPQGARLAPDGKYYVSDPARPGKYLQVGV